MEPAQTRAEKDSGRAELKITRSVTWEHTGSILENSVLNHKKYDKVDLSTQTIRTRDSFNEVSLVSLLNAWNIASLSLINFRLEMQSKKRVRFCSEQKARKSRGILKKISKFLRKVWFNSLQLKKKTQNKCSVTSTAVFIFLVFFKGLHISFFSR